MNKNLTRLEEEVFELKVKINEYEKKTRLFENILDKIEEPIYVYNKEGVLIYINSAGEKIEEKNASMIIGKTETEIWNTNLSIQLIKSKDIVKDTKIYYTTPNNKKIHVIHSMYPYFDENKIMGCFSITKDITQIDNMAMDIYGLQNELKNKKNTLTNGTRYTLNDIIGTSEVTKKYIEKAYKASKYQCNILIYGETGTGKELVAQGIHNASENSAEPFVGINCSAIPSNLVESILFGTVKGAFTGSLETKGLFEQAGKGTLFLDEVNSMPIDIQSKLLRVLQEKRYRKIGDSKDYSVRCRIISATNIESKKAIELGQLRQDLYYRLAALTITIPPLRERTEDIKILLYHFMNKYNKIFNTKFESIDMKLINACKNYGWPGNIRELEHMVESALIVSENFNKILSLELLPIYVDCNNEVIDTPQKDFNTYYFKETKIIDLNDELNNYETEIIKKALMNNNGNIAATARQLSIHRSVLYNKMKKLDINLEKIRVCELI